jgi:hypothetical protein
VPTPHCLWATGLSLSSVPDNLLDSWSPLQFAVCSWITSTSCELYFAAAPCSSVLLLFLQCATSIWLKHLVILLWACRCIWRHNWQLNNSGPHSSRWPQQTWGPRAASPQHQHGWSPIQAPKAHHDRHQAPIRISSKSCPQTRLATSHSPCSWPCPLPNHFAPAILWAIYSGSGRLWTSSLAASQTN